MAQVSRQTLRLKLRRLSRRAFGGAVGRKKLVAAACALLLLCGIAGLAAAASRGGGVFIERGGAEAGGGAAEAGDRADSEASETSDAAGADDGGGEGASGERAAAEAVAPATLLVDVDGAVVAPGVYALSEGSRVNDAVLAAGGLAEGADTSSVNLAKPLSDGEKVYVPKQGEGPASNGASAASGASGGSAAKTTGAKPSGLVNINKATAEELQTLSGVGEATAAAIIQEREANGPFSSIEDLMRVSGIGEKKFTKLKGQICV